MTLKIAGASIKLTPLDFTGNKNSIVQLINIAKQQKVGILCFPELCISGYGCEDGFYFESTITEGYKSLHEICQQSKGICAIVGLAVKVEEFLYNCMAVLYDSKILGIVPKQYLANDGVHYEKRWFTGWEQGKTIALNIQGLGENILFGDQVFDLHGKKFGFEICEDAWVNQLRPAYKLLQKNVDIVFNPSASHFGRRKSDIRTKLTIEGSNVTNGMQVLVNHLGNEAGKMIYDGDIIFAHQGKLVKKADRLTFADYNLVTCEIADNYQEIKNTPQTIEDTYSDFTKACALGLYDYLIKSGQKGFVLSLSGGADSAAVALLVKAAVYFAVKEHGAEEISNRIKLPKSCITEDELLSSVMHCLYQSTKQNSPVTNSAAKELSQALKIPYSEIVIEDLVQEYRNKIEQVTGRSLTWSNDDLALQNIQARVRSPGIWFLANIRNSLLLTTGNRSECAVGYATMDGDTSGSIAPIAGVSKFFIQNWLKWLQSNNVDGFGPFPELSIITNQKPTAELRPLESGQTDEKDLMPYEVLDLYEELVLSLRLSSSLVLDKAAKTFKQKYSKDQLSGWLNKFYHLWRVSQWKRERFAPSFHLDGFSVDPKSWLRFPILSAGLVKDL